PIVPAPQTFGYRNKMEFSFHPDAGGRAQLGLHERGTFDRVFEIQDCLLPSRLTLDIVRRTQAFADARRWRAYHPRHHLGDVRYLVVRHLPHTDQCAVHLVATTDTLEGLEEWARAVGSSSSAVRTVSLLVNRSRANVALGESERILLGDGLIEERLLGLTFEAGAGAFLQTNSRQAETLYAATIEAAALAPEETVLDLYCGTGTLTLLLARGARLAVGVESEPRAIEAARRNAARNGVANARFVIGEARPVLREWARGERPAPVRPDVVVVDPPRAGLHPRVVARIAELEPKRVVYVSCNPATLARDLKDFRGLGYALDAVTPFDMFPHTPHIECVARLGRVAAESCLDPAAPPPRPGLPRSGSDRRFPGQGQPGHLPAGPADRRRDLQCRSARRQHRFGRARIPQDEHANRRTDAREADGPHGEPLRSRAPLLSIERDGPRRDLDHGGRGGRGRHRAHRVPRGEGRPGRRQPHDRAAGPLVRAGLRNLFPLQPDLPQAPRSRLRLATHHAADPERGRRHDRGGAGDRSRNRDDSLGRAAGAGAQAPAQGS
ncbi:MAG: 23S rRNA (uracil(1939)-C(5))-methyltransferase RlmD, partial [Candidatus Eisenbacteria bacterium]